ncbi:SDR family oxidoreductase [Nocardioides sp. cx-173]|uniref:SDR family oxidoreductase n=1 Tax=Nocardioides sp. cx-173 TaxID=2898796 RepID=UPI001E359656|nr:SDR family oxidoreductase [Nocardioides sp. cx-173]MCD4523559.1 SDR family oxidoreductase [Nocardioides sp. cx-173]UGB42104.1 SDR family oxidoreductase [Nocardioides sp. cx-173]
MTTWLITGTSSGFGRSLTELLLERGDTVAATLRRPDALADLQSRHGTRLWVRTLDVTDTPALRRVVDEAFAELGTVDVAVSNAGYGLFGAAEELDDAEILRQLDTNVVASIQLARALVPHLRGQGGGRILQLSSLGGQVGFPGLSVYHASKWAIEGFFEAFGPEVAPFGIQTMLVEPGMSRTEFAGSSARIGAPHTRYDGGVLRVDSVAREAMPGDPRKMARAMIAAAERDQLPARLSLGSDAYTMIREALQTRLARLEEQRDLAFSTDADDYRPPPAA